MEEVIIDGEGMLLSSAMSDCQEKERAVQCFYYFVVGVSAVGRARALGHHSCGALAFGCLGQSALDVPRGRARRAIESVSDRPEQVAS